MAASTHIQVGTGNPIGAGVVSAVSAVRTAIEDINKYGGILMAFGDDADGKAALAAALQVSNPDPEVTAAQAVAVRTHITNVQSLITHPYFVTLLDDLGQ